jgi:hypothetical protein
VEAGVIYLVMKEVVCIIASKKCQKYNKNNIISAYWIAQKAIKYLIDVNDNFIDCNDEILELQNLIFEHFRVIQ